MAGNPRKTDNLTANVPTYFFSSEISHVATIAGTQHNDTALGALPFLFTDAEAASRCSHTVRAYGNPSSSITTSRYGLELWNPVASMEGIHFVIIFIVIRTKSVEASHRVVGNQGVGAEGHQLLKGRQRPDRDGRP